MGAGHPVPILYQCRTLYQLGLLLASIANSLGVKAPTLPEKPDESWLADFQDFIAQETGAVDQEEELEDDIDSAVDILGRGGFLVG